jgi:hypothetical protein
MPPITNLGIIYVKKTGTLTFSTLKTFDKNELYKKCGFKTTSGFAMQTEWKVRVDHKGYLIQLFGKTNGKAGTENKYEFPPPVDKVLYFGTCALVCKDAETSAYMSLSIDLWKKIYNKLMGGFYDIDDDDEEMIYEDEDDVLDTIDKSKKTSTGYLKDKFVVDDDEEIDEDDGVMDVDDDEEWHSHNNDNADEVDDDDKNDVDDEIKIDSYSELSEEGYITESSSEE